jgi:hypothetical protein
MKSNDSLVMCYVILLILFPVITDNAIPNVSKTNFRLCVNGSYSNYQYHYIPVAPIDEATSRNYLPPPRGVQYAMYDEFVVFQEYDILPQAIVHLKRRQVSSGAAATYKANPSKNSL